MKSAYENGDNLDPPLLAWRARNLLELLVWSRCCANSAEAARRFHEDAGRDAEGIYGVFEKWGTTNEKPEDWFVPIKEARTRLHREASKAGIKPPDSNYRRVRKAAEECGFPAYFDTMNTFLSKFCHPTALVVFAPGDHERDKSQAEYFFAQGCIFFYAGIETIEERLSTAAA